MPPGDRQQLGAGGQLLGDQRLQGRPVGGRHRLAAVVDLGQAVGLGVADRDARPRLARAPRPRGAAAPRSASCSSIQRPAWPRRIVTATTSAPSVCAARAAFRPLPPGTATDSVGRWMAPGTSRSTYVQAVDRRVRGDADQAAHGRHLGRGRELRSRRATSRPRELLRFVAAPAGLRSRRPRGPTAIRRRPRGGGSPRAAGRRASRRGTRRRRRRRRRSRRRPRPRARRPGRPSSRATTSPPSAPSFIATTGPRAASARAASSASSTPAIRRASSRFGRTMSVASRIWPIPPSHDPVGSQLGSNDVVRPSARARPKTPASCGPEPVLEEEAPDVEMACAREQLVGQVAGGQCGHRADRR